MSASTFMLINAKGFSNPASWLIGLLQGLVAGASSRSTSCRDRLEMLARALPQTYAIDAARRLLLDGPAPAPLATIGPLSPLGTDFLLLAVMAVAVPCLGRLDVRGGNAQGPARWRTVTLGMTLGRAERAIRGAELGLTMVEKPPFYWKP